MKDRLEGEEIGYRKTSEEATVAQANGNGARARVVVYGRGKSVEGDSTEMSTDWM